MEIILANILSFSGSLLDFLFNLKYNEKAKILICSCFSSALSLIALILLGAFDGVIECAVTILRLITIYLKEKFNENFYVLFVLFVGLYSLVFLKFSGIQTIILFIGAMCSFIPKWFSKDMQVIRRFARCAMVLAIVYNMMVNNFAAISIQIVNIILITISIIKWDRKLRKKNEKVLAKVKER